MSPAYIEADLGPLDDLPAAEDVHATPIGPHAVRFSSVNEEIEPKQSLYTMDSTPTKPQLSGEIEAEIRALTSPMHGTHLQTRRMSNFAFEPMSLPTSRVCITFLFYIRTLNYHFMTTPLQRLKNPHEV
jgi:hypothetical protein